MNKNRRLILKKALQSLESAEQYIETALDGEQYSFDNIPENLETSEQYYKMESAIEQLEAAIEAIDESRGYIEEASA